MKAKDRVQVGHLLNYLLTYLLTCLFTYLLTSLINVLLGNLNGSMLVKEFPTFYGTQKFITSFTRARHLYLS